MEPCIFLEPSLSFVLYFPGRIPLIEGFQVGESASWSLFTDSDPFWCGPVKTQRRESQRGDGTSGRCRDALGVSQRVATTRGKDWGAVISCFKDIYPSQTKF